MQKGWFSYPCRYINSCNAAFRYHRVLQHARRRLCSGLSRIRDEESHEKQRHRLEAWADREDPNIDLYEDMQSLGRPTSVRPKRTNSLLLNVYPVFSAWILTNFILFEFY